MAERDRPHILVPTQPASEPFTPIRTPVTSGGGGFRGSRREHGKRLTEEFEAAWTPPVDEPETTGTYLTFASFPGLDLMFESLESRRLPRWSEPLPRQPDRLHHDLNVHQVQTRRSGALVHYMRQPSIVAPRTSLITTDANRSSRNAANARPRPSPSASTKPGHDMADRSRGSSKVPSAADRCGK